LAEDRDRAGLKNSCPGLLAARVVHRLPAGGGPNGGVADFLDGHERRESARSGRQALDELFGKDLVDQATFLDEENLDSFAIPVPEDYSILADTHTIITRQFLFKRADVAAFGT
jgi:hypothetical protein